MPHENALERPNFGRCISPRHYPQPEPPDNALAVDARLHVADETPCRDTVHDLLNCDDEDCPSCGMWEAAWEALQD